ncbi:hypothetical protein GCM10023090_18680 [Acidovorax lacteus]|uniref:Uncharacterized protein n=1 Tax=Acidovorax lacteus TaxID=1924988 RepID=A0ABP8L9E8_9BURK
MRGVTVIGEANGLRERVNGMAPPQRAATSAPALTAAVCRGQSLEMRRAPTRIGQHNVRTDARPAPQRVPQCRRLGPDGFRKFSIGVVLPMGDPMHGYGIVHMRWHTGFAAHKTPRCRDGLARGTAYYTAPPPGTVPYASRVDKEFLRTWRAPRRWSRDGAAMASRPDSSC